MRRWPGLYKIARPDKGDTVSHEDEKFSSSTVGQFQGGEAVLRALAMPQPTNNRIPQ